MNYTRALIAKSINDKTGMGLDKATLAVDLVFETIGNIQDGDTVELRGFGTFTRKAHYPHNKRNPNTGAKVEAEPYSDIRFRPSKLTRWAV